LYYLAEVSRGLAKSRRTASATLVAPCPPNSVQPERAIVLFGNWATADEMVKILLTKLNGSETGGHTSAYTRRYLFKVEYPLTLVFGVVEAPQQ